MLCPACSHVLLVCDEIGNVFDNLADPLASAPLVIWRSVGQMCPQCKAVLLADFGWATQDDLINRGLGRDDYEVADPGVDRSIRHLASG
jgi:hypothetical protein